MIGNEDEWSPRIEPYTQEENDAEMNAVRSVGNSESARKQYESVDRWRDFVRTFIHNMHITADDLETEDDVEFYARAVVKQIIDSTGPKPGEYDTMKDAAKYVLRKIMQGEPTPEIKGNQFAKPRKPLDIDKTKDKINESKFNIKRFVGNVYDKIKGM